MADGFFVGNELRKVSVSGGAPASVARIPSAPRGASWGDDDFIVLTTADAEGLYRVAAAGGEPRLLVHSDRAKKEMIAYPHVLPGSKTVLLTTYPQESYMAVRIDAFDIASGSRRTVLESAADPTYVEPGYLIFANANTSPEVRYRASLRAVRFDAERVQVKGDAVTVVDAVMAGVTNGANYTVSRRGDLVYVPGGTSAAAEAQRTLLWVDRNGKEQPIKAQPRAYAVARISPDGTRLALDARDQTGDIWVWDIGRETLTPLDRHVAQDMSPIWSPSGKDIIWSSTRAGGNPNLYRRAADGSGTTERLTTNNGNQFPTAMTPDGNSILLFGAGGGSMDIYRVDLNEPERRQVPLIASPAFDFGADLSPDGKWVAYHSNESGESQVYVRPFPAVDGGRSQISQNGGSRAAWSRSGTELFYLDRDGFLTSVPVKTDGGQFSAGAPSRLLKTAYYRGFSVLGLDLRAYDVAPDGKRFLMIKESETNPREQQTATMVVTLNFDEELRLRLPNP
jgi:eukaryotic-like serine/threonine-protein kinase